MELLQQLLQWELAGREVSADVILLQQALAYLIEADTSKQYSYFNKILANTMSRNTSVILSEHFEGFVELQVNSGQYHSVSEVIRAGLRLLEEHEQMIQAVREAIIAGEQSGPMQTIDREAFKDEMRHELQCN